MAKIELYTKATCPYSRKATALLREKGVNYREMDVELDPENFEEMKLRSSGRHTTPQIFIDGRHIGGYSDLEAVDASGELDRWLEPDPVGASL